MSQLRFTWFIMSRSSGRLWNTRFWHFTHGDRPPMLTQSASIQTLPQILGSPKLFRGLCRWVVWGSRSNSFPSNSELLHSVTKAPSPVILHPSLFSVIIHNGCNKLIRRQCWSTSWEARWEEEGHQKAEGMRREMPRIFKCKKRHWEHYDWSQLRRGRYVMCPHHSGPKPSLCVLAVVQSISPVQLSATPWTAAHQALLSSTVSQSLLKLISIESWCYLTISSSVAPFSFCLQSFPASGSFPMSWLFTSGGPSIGVSASASVLPMSIQGWFPSGLTDFISLQSKGLSRVVSSTTVWKHQFFGTQPCWRRLLRVPWTARRSNQSILREISPGISLEGMMLKLKLQYFLLMRRVDSLEKTLMLGGIGGRRKRGDDRGLDGWMASLTRWTWVWVNSGSWWWTRRPGVLWFMGSQSVGHDWATELNSLLYGPTLTSVHDYRKNHSFDYTDLCWLSDVSAF